MSWDAILMLILGVGSAAWSLYVGIMLLTDSWSPSCAADTELEYISTRLARCLDRRPAEVWSLVYCVEFQILLLLTVWRRLLSSYHVVSWLRPWIISFGVWFIISFAMVVEFRNDRDVLSNEFLWLPAFQESSLHVYAAVCTMISLTLLHACMCLSLFALSSYEIELAHSKPSPARPPPARTDGYQPVGAERPGAAGARLQAIDWQMRRSDEIMLDTAKPGELRLPGSSKAQQGHAAQQAHGSQQTQQAQISLWSEYKRALQKYVVLDWVYLVCIVVFFVTWSLNNNEGPLYSTAVRTEWIVLVVAAFMHGYALWQSNRPLSWVQDEPAGLLTHVLRSMHTASRCEYSWRDLGMCCTYVVALLYTLLIFGMVPLAASDDPEHARSSIMLLLVVVTAYAYSALLLMA